MRDCHNSANEKPLYFELSIPPMGSLLTSLPRFLFELLLRVLVTLRQRELPVARHRCRLGINNSLLILSKSTFTSEVTGSLFV